jgi:hypothetical protein
MLLFPERLNPKRNLRPSVSLIRELRDRKSERLQTKRNALVFCNLRAVSAGSSRPPPDADVVVESQSREAGQIQNNRKADERLAWLDCI